MNAKGTLVDGIVIDGVTYRDFELEPVNAGIEMDAADMCVALKKTGAGNLELARFAASMRIDGVDAVLFEDVRRMSVADMDIVYAVKNEAKKKEISGGNLPVKLD